MAEKWRIHSGEYLGEISALSFLHLPSHFSSLPYLLAGTGSHVLVYDLESSSIIQSFNVFNGIRVHGITCHSIRDDSLSRSFGFCVAVFGEKRVKLFRLYVNMVNPESVDQESVGLDLIHSLPRFSHWVLDVSFLKGVVLQSCDDGRYCVAIGCSNNSVYVWDINTCSLSLQVHSPERCLLYSMRLWGDNLGDLRIASGTIFNEIIIWKIVSEDGSPSSTSLAEDGQKWINSNAKTSLLHCTQHRAAHLGKLVGHEGSIFRIAWSSDGLKLISASDDRSVRIWTIGANENGSDNQLESMAAVTVLFGHNARVWDCCIFDSLVVTAGEDCTCRVWTLDGEELRLIKEHIGRGVWRCLYDPSSSIIITAGFDSAIKVHLLPDSLPQSLSRECEHNQSISRKLVLSGRIPHSNEHNGLVDSKSEYVRCLHFASEDTLYVATNQGYLYHAKVSETEDIKWTKLLQVSEEVPIVCMDLLSQALPKSTSGVCDCALGDGKGNVTIVRVLGHFCPPKVDCLFNWSAGKERQLLGVYYCKALGYRHIFTSDPRGNLKLWILYDSSQSVSEASAYNAFLVAEFASCFGFRIMCLGVSFEDKILVCGDLRGNLALFPLPKTLFMEKPTLPEEKIAPSCWFKGAHGISSVCNISVVKLSSYLTEICSTGADGCICNLEYDSDRQVLDFIGLKQVKELSLIQSVADNTNSFNDGADCRYAVGFASTDFIIWNLLTETKVVQIPCGGWRRPYSFYLGDVPEVEHSFAYVKDERIYIHRQWADGTESKIYPQNLHIQFHGREMHSLCFVSESSPVEANGKHGPFDGCSWIATGCEDGTVRLTRYVPGTESWSASKLLGEHVGGSAVRSLCFVSRMNIIASDISSFPDRKVANSASMEDRESPSLLISVGAKRVLTSWLLRDRRSVESCNSLIEQVDNGNGNGCSTFLEQSSSLSFKWLSTDMPTKIASSNVKTEDTEGTDRATKDLASLKFGKISESFAMEKEERKSKSDLDKCQDDWRYLAVTAFLVMCSGSRLTVCFVLVASSDATLALRALVLPHRLWYDVAQLVCISSPVLALQHVIVPTCQHSEDNAQLQNLYIVISGATDGSIVFWDLTDTVEAFMQRLSSFDVEELINSPARPRTGRGSQGGRWWKSLCSKPRKIPGKQSITSEAGEQTKGDLVTRGMKCSQTVTGDAEVNNVEDSPGTSEIWPMHAISNTHQSGINCLHVSHLEDCQSSEDCAAFGLISGGDDQALHYHKFEVSRSSRATDLKAAIPDLISFPANSKEIYDSNGCRRETKRMIRLLCHAKITSAHSSAIKGVWMDGNWVFSTGLDQRLRFWLLEEHDKLIEKFHLIISVPEPEALHARAFGRNQYQIAVAGRGMQMVVFSAS